MGLSQLASLGRAIRQVRCNACAVLGVLVVIGALAYFAAVKSAWLPARLSELLFLVFVALALAACPLINWWQQSREAEGSGFYSNPPPSEAEMARTKKKFDRAARTYQGRSDNDGQEPEDEIA